MAISNVCARDLANTFGDLLIAIFSFKVVSKTSSASLGSDFLFFFDGGVVLSHEVREVDGVAADDCRGGDRGRSSSDGEGVLCETFFGDGVSLVLESSKCTSTEAMTVVESWPSGDDG